MRIGWVWTGAPLVVAAALFAPDRQQFLAQAVSLWGLVAGRDHVASGPGPRWLDQTHEVEP